MGKVKSPEQHLEDCILAHIHEPNHYGYDKFLETFTGYKNKVLIYCYHCKKYFWQRVGDHKSGSGCYDCSKIEFSKKKSKDAQYFLDTILEKHGDFYSYLDFSEFLNTFINEVSKCQLGNLY